MSKLRQDADAIIQAAITAAQPDEAVRKALEGRDFGSGRVVLVAAGKGGICALSFTLLDIFAIASTATSVAFFIPLRRMIGLAPASRFFIPS